MVNPARQFQEPCEGTYSVRLARGGMRVPVRIEKTDGMWTATVSGETLPERYSSEEYETVAMTALVEGTVSSHPFVKLVTFGRVISEEEYDRMLARIVWARDNAPDDPSLHPKNPIYLSRMKSLW